MNKTNPQSGMTLVELLIAMGLGIFLMAGVLQVFLGSKQTYSTINAQSHMQENGRFAMGFLARTLRQGGYRTDIDLYKITAEDRVIETFPQSALYTVADFDPTAIVTGINNAVGYDDVKSQTDVVRVRIQGAEDAQVADCEGRAIDENESAYISYFVNDDGEFRCETLYEDGRSGTVTLVEGVDNLQVQYGVSSGKVESTEEVTVGEIVNADDVADWRNVVSIRVALLAASDGAPMEHSVAQTYELLDNAAPVEHQDGKVRQIFTQTINLRNPTIL